MSLRDLSVRFSALLLTGAVFASDALAYRVTYPDREVCVSYFECTETCTVDRYGRETCTTDCTPVEVCFGSPTEEIDDGDDECDFNDPDFFHCIGVIQP